MYPIDHSEYSEVKSFMQRFFDSYYKERDYKKISSMVDDSIIFVGLGHDEIADSRESFSLLMKHQVDVIPDPIHYFIRDYHQVPTASNMWACYALIDFRVTSGTWGLTNYLVRLTATISKKGISWTLVTLHASESTTLSLNINEFSTKNLDESPMRSYFSQHDISSIILQLIPGGIITRSLDTRYTLGSVNSRCLDMLGYSTPKEFIDAVGDSFINALHPDDVDKYIYTAQFIKQNAKEFESDYRIQRKDGTYLWVHDIGRKTVSAEGTELIISIITDISAQVEYRSRLESESSIDFLTNILNRKGASEAIHSLENTYNSCILLLIDIDNFKQINDNYGHLAGDSTLQYLANILSTAFTPPSVICRLGGDEFGIFIPSPQNIQAVRDLLQRISENFHSLMMDSYPKSGSSLSIGGIYGSSKLSLIHEFEKADANLYKVKNSGKGGILITELCREVPGLN